jgi:hypothetical protein
MAGIISVAAAKLTGAIIELTGIHSLAAAQAINFGIQATLYVGAAAASSALSSALASGPSPSAQRQSVRQAVGARMRYYGCVGSAVTLSWAFR